MTEFSQTEFAKRMVLLARAADRFLPIATYDADGDCIEFLIKSDPFYAERIDDLATVYYSQETGELVGSLIKGVSGFCAEMTRRLPGFRIEIHDGPVHLEHIFRAKLWTSQSDPQGIITLIYRKLIDAAADADVTVKADLCET
jgi:hypothetical protein